MNNENQPAMKKYPFCSEEIPTHAFICKHCGELLSKQPVEGQRTYPEYSNAQTLWWLFLLYVISFGLYHFYWFYRNWKHLKIQKKLSISPGWRTVGLFVPLLNIVLICIQFKDIRDFAKKAGCTIYPSLGLGDCPTRT